MSESTHVTGRTRTGLRALTYGFRGLQLLLTGLAAIIAVGALDATAIAAVGLGVYTLVLLAFVVVVEFVAVRPCRGRV